MKNKDGNINKEELREACSQSGFPVANDLLDSLFVECDQDKDGAINFLEFSNFLCFKDSMKNGFDSKISGILDFTLNRFISIRLNRILSSFHFFLLKKRIQF